MANKNVSHPAHYTTGKIEVIEAIEDWKMGFHRGNAIKYVARAGLKNPDKEIEDLEKAVWYLNQEIERLQATKENRTLKRPSDMQSISAIDVSNSKKLERLKAIAPNATSYGMIGEWKKSYTEDKYFFEPTVPDARAVEFFARFAKKKIIMHTNGKKYA